MSNVSDLWAVQQTDLAVEAIRRRLKELEHQRSEPAEITAARAAYTAANNELVHWRTTRRDLEIQARELSGKIEAAEKDLMSGRVRNPKELEGMHANVGSLKRRLSAVEDQELEAMLQTEQWQSDTDARKSELDAIETDWQATQQANAAEVAAKLAELKRLAASMNQQWAGLSPEDQHLYRDLRARKGGRAVADERNGTCQACGISLPTGIIQAVRNDEVRTFCPSCGRLLHAG
ncbi:MAG: C4-type zinc ribbon domain-containing protein [Caldilineales bacterium]